MKETVIILISIIRQECKIKSRKYIIESYLILELKIAVIQMPDYPMIHYKGILTEEEKSQIVNREMLFHYLFKETLMMIII